MAASSSTTTPWRPPSDDELTWFKPGGTLPHYPTPLEYSVAVEAFTFGVSRALESLYFPLYEVRPRLVEGELYFAAVPSAMAERELDAQLGRMRDSGIRFTKSVRGIWDRAIKREIEEYNDRLAAFAAEAASDADIARSLLPFRRTRANQWFAATRAIFAPTIMLRRGIGSSSVDEAIEVTGEALEAIQTRGTHHLNAALHRIGERLVRRGVIDRADDVQWLTSGEVHDALVTTQTLGDTVAQREAARPAHLALGPDQLGPSLPPDAPRMYLLREVISLIA